MGWARIGRNGSSSGGGGDVQGERDVVRWSAGRAGRADSGPVPQLTIFFRLLASSSTCGTVGSAGA